VRRLSPNSCRPTSIVPRRTPEYSPRVISRQAWGAEFQHTCMPTGGLGKITKGRQPHSHSALSTDLWAGYLLWADHSQAADPDHPSLSTRPWLTLFAKRIALPARRFIVSSSLVRS
jgi:hypothetical protein